MEHATQPSGIRVIDHDIPLTGANGNLLVTWWVPTEQPVVGVAWLQHGYARNPHYLRTLAGALAGTGLLVAMPTVPSFRRARSINDVAYLDAIGSALVTLGAPDGPVQAVARVAGIEVPVDAAQRIVPVAHSAGCAVVARSVRRARTEGGEVQGVVLLDPTENLSRSFASSLPGLAGLTVRGVFAKPSRCNRKGQGAAALRDNRGGFVGVVLTSGTHCDAEGDDSDRVCRAMCGRPDPVNVGLLYEMATAWTRDLALGRSTPAWEPGGERLEDAVAQGRVAVL